MVTRIQHVVLIPLFFSFSWFWFARPQWSVCRGTSIGQYISYVQCYIRINDEFGRWLKTKCIGRHDGRVFHVLRSLCTGPPVVCVRQMRVIRFCGKSKKYDRDAFESATQAHGDACARRNMMIYRCQRGRRRKFWKLNFRTERPSSLKKKKNVYVCEWTAWMGWSYVILYCGRDWITPRR